MKRTVQGLLIASLASYSLFAVEVDNGMMRKLSNVSVKLIEKQKETEIKYDALYKMHKKLDKRLDSYIDANKKDNVDTVNKEIKDIKVDLLQKDISDSKLELSINDNSSKVKLMDLRLEEMEKQLDQYKSILDNNDALNYDKLKEMKENILKFNTTMKDMEDFFKKSNKDINNNVLFNTYQDKEVFDGFRKDYEEFQKNRKAALESEVKRVLEEMEKANKTETDNRNKRIVREMDKQNEINSQLNQKILKQNALLEKQAKEIEDLKSRFSNLQKHVSEPVKVKVIESKTNSSSTSSISDKDMAIIDSYISE